MNFLKKRSTAVIVFLAVVGIFSFLGSRRSLNSACREAESAFFDRSLLQQERAYSCPADHLENCVALSNRLLSVLSPEEPWQEAYNSLKLARRSLDDALEARDIALAADAYQAMKEAVEQVERTRAKGAQPVSSHDDYDSILSDLTSALQAASEDAYSRHLQAFQKSVLDRFPANILLHLTGVQAPEPFPGEKT